MSKILCVTTPEQTGINQRRNVKYLSLAVCFPCLTEENVANNDSMSTDVTDHFQQPHNYQCTKCERICAKGNASKNVLERISPGGRSIWHQVSQMG